MSMSGETLAYALLIVLVAVSAGLFVYNVAEVTAGPRRTDQSIELKDFGAKKETDFAAAQLTNALKAFEEVDRFGPIATPIPSPTPLPTNSPVPTLPPCAVGWRVHTLTRRIVKIEPKGGTPQYVRVGETLDGVTILEVDIKEQRVKVSCEAPGGVGKAQEKWLRRAGGEEAATQ